MIRPGMRLKVVDLDGCKAGNGKKPPFRLGDVVVCRRVSPTGQVGLHEHRGWWRPHRFELLSANHD